MNKIKRMEETLAAGRLKAGSVPLISDGEGMYTVPEQYRPTCLPLDEESKRIIRGFREYFYFEDAVKGLVREFRELFTP